LHGLVSPFLNVVFWGRIQDIAPIGSVQFNFLHDYPLPKLLVLKADKPHLQRENLPSKIHHQKDTSHFLSNSYLQLPRRGRNKPHDPASGLKKESKCRAVFHKANDQFTGAFDNPSGDVDERKPNRLHTPGHPGFSQGHLLHDAIEIHSQNHDPPLGGILAKVIGGQLAAGKILFHDRMSFL